MATVSATANKPLDTASETGVDRWHTLEVRMLTRQTLADCAALVSIVICMSLWMFV